MSLAAMFLVGALLLAYGLLALLYGGEGRHPGSTYVRFGGHRLNAHLSMAIEPAERGRETTAISNAIVRMHRDHYGRGATTVRTIIQRDYVVCFLSDIYTPVERTLIEAGQRDAVRATRNIFQDAMSAKFTEAVEAATGRTVIAFMSQVCFDPDMAAEVFVLEPLADGPPA